jgi:hypothetical protein
MTTDLIKDSNDNVLSSVKSRAGGERVLRDAQGIIKPRPITLAAPTNEFSPRETF